MPTQPDPIDEWADVSERSRVPHPRQTRRAFVGLVFVVVVFVVLPVLAMLAA